MNHSLSRMIAGAVGVCVVLMGCSPRQADTLGTTPSDSTAHRYFDPVPDSLWTPLFNGIDLSGWSHIGKGRFQMEQGVLKTEGGMGLLWYDRSPLQNVVLKVVYRNVEGSNSGVFIRIPASPDDPWEAVNGGYEVQIDDDEDDYHVTGVLYSFTKARKRGGTPGQWNTMSIAIDGPRTVVCVNDSIVTDYVEGQPVRQKPWWLFWKFWTPRRGQRPLQGYVGLQNHGSGDTVLFREVSVRPLKSDDGTR